MAGKLNQRVAELERLNVQLDQRTAERAEQLRSCEGRPGTGSDEAFMGGKELTQANSACTTKLRATR